MKKNPFFILLISVLAICKFFSVLSDGFFVAFITSVILGITCWWGVSKLIEFAENDYKKF